MAHETKSYLGDGLYARFENAHMMTLYTERTRMGGDDTPTGVTTHWVALEPELFLALLQFACACGWGGIIDRVAHQRRTPDNA